MLTRVLIEAHNPSPMTGRGNNTFLVAGGSGEAALVDAGTGAPDHLNALASHLQAKRLRLGRVIVTHGHADHASGAPALASAFPDASFAKFAWPDDDGRFGVPWQALQDGDEIRVGADALVVLHTPGHAPDHVALWHEASGVAFTGDLVVSGSSVMIDASRGGDMRAYLASLERVLALSPRLLLPAHGPAVDEPAPLLKSYIAHRLMRERQVVDALARGHATVEAIVDSIYDGVDPALLPAAGENVRAHLAKLQAESQAICEDGRWRLRG